LEKYVKLGKMGLTWKNGSDLEKWVTLEKNLGHTWKNESPLKKLVTSGKLISLGKKGCTLGKKGRICKNG